MEIEESLMAIRCKLEYTIHKRSDFIYYRSRVSFNDWIYIRGSLEEHTAYDRIMSLKNDKKLDNR